MFAPKNSPKEQKTDRTVWANLKKLSSNGNFLWRFLRNPSDVMFFITVMKGCNFNITYFKSIWWIIDLFEQILLLLLFIYIYYTILFLHLK